MSEQDPKEAAYQDAKRAEYLERLKLLEGLVAEQASSLDKTLITLSGGAFALSIGFVNQLAPNPISVGWLITSWVSFGFALLATLFSFFFSVKALKRGQVLTDKDYFPEDFQHVKDGNPYDIITEVLNIMAIIAFVLGISSLAFFGVRNILR